MAKLADLPPEMIQEVISYLSIPSLLAFGLTSRINHAHQSNSLSSLRLGVFPSNLSGLISFTEANEYINDSYSLQVVLPKADSRTKAMVIRKQNAIVRRVVEQYRQTLRNLEVALWELNHSSVASIATLENLRHLSIRLDHPHTRHFDLDRTFWKSSPGSTVWNSLFTRPNSCPDGKKIFGRLEALTLERAGITDYQLQKVLESNPYIKQLKLQKCLLLTEETFQNLASNPCGNHIELLHFTHNPNDYIDDRILKYIGKLPILKVSL